MSERFAKLFETTTTQVLIFFTQKDDGSPQVCRWLYAGGVELGLHLGWDDDSEESFAKAEQVFNDHDQASAEQLVASASEWLNKNGFYDGSE